MLLAASAILAGCSGRVSSSAPSCENPDDETLCLDANGQALCGSKTDVPGASFAPLPPNAVPCPEGFACLVYSSTGALVGQGTCRVQNDNE